MRRVVCLAMVLLAGVGVAQAQTLWGGVGASTAWEWESKVNPEHRLSYTKGVSPSVFVALPISDDASLRFRAAEIRHDILYVNNVVEGRLRAYTVGVDYFLPGNFGQSVLSAGVGAYDMTLDLGLVKDLEGMRLGWYLGVGEWFELTKRSRVIAEIELHRTENWGKPIIATASVGLAFWF
jgi:hypothetical protein